MLSDCRGYSDGSRTFFFGSQRYLFPDPFVSHPQSGATGAFACPSSRVQRHHWEARWTASSQCFGPAGLLSHAWEVIDVYEAISSQACKMTNHQTQSSERKKGGHAHDWNTNSDKISSPLKVQRAKWYWNGANFFIKAARRGICVCFLFFLADFLFGFELQALKD